MEGVELICFKIISEAGSARSSYMDSIKHAKLNEMELAKEAIRVGNEYFINSHHAHSSLLEMDAKGELENLSLLLMHSEDQLMNAEATKIMAEEFIYLYENHIFS